MTDEDGAGGFRISFAEIATMLLRRRLWLLLPTVLGLVLAVAAVVRGTPVYRSSATLLIDSQQIPTTLVASPLTNVAEERIAKIRQQVMSRVNLAELVRRYGLYPERRAEMSFDDVLNVMRGAIGVDLVGANATPSGDGGGATIAFTLSFTYADPAVARTVTRRLTEMFLSADKRIRTEQATGTATFLGRRAEERRRQLTDLEEERRSIEARYAGALPSQVALSAQSEAALRAEVSRIDAETQGLGQQNSLLAARDREISQAPPPGIETLRRAEERLNQLTAIYSDNYPEVAAARVAVAKQRASLAGERTPIAGSSVISLELAAARSRIASLAAHRGELVATISAMDRRTAQAPQASYELNRVEREYDNIKRQYEALREKQTEAQVAANLQSEDKGERFSVVDEPSTPFEPVGRKPIVTVATGLFGGLALGLMLVLAWEFATGAIHGELALSRVLGAPPLTIIPVLRPDAGRGPLAAIRSILIRSPGGRRGRPA